MDRMKLAENSVFSILIFVFLAFTNAAASSKIGVNYGLNGDNLQSVYHSIRLLQSMNAGRVKIYDANPEVLKLLSGTRIHASIMVQDGLISDIASDQSTADQWVNDNILAYYPQTMIRFVLVGNEVLSSKNTTLWYDLVPAMMRIHNAIKAQGIQNIKVGTPVAMDILESTFPPSSGKFRPELLNHQVIVPLLSFLNKTRSYFFVNVFPYFPWSENPTNMSLDFALFTAKNSTYRDPGSGLNYTNLLDQMLDSVHFAAGKLGFDHISLAISETGWPNAGDIDQPGANPRNAAIYNRNLIRRLSVSPPIGTPARPGLVIPTFLFSLYDENQKSGRGTERHWGMLQPNGVQNYEINLTGAHGESNYPPLPQPKNNKPFRGEIWCVVAPDSRIMDLGPVLDSVCKEGNGTLCDALAPGKECYEPVSIVAHASYAFSSYWAKYRDNASATCYFNGFAEQTTNDPSHGSCKFPSVTI